MTHDELLGRLDDYGFGVPPLNALRSVVELHKPIEVETEGGTFTICENCVQTYPCTTIQAIEKELG